MSTLNKKLTISIPILIIIVVSVVATTILMNNHKPDISNWNTTNVTKMDKMFVTISDKKYEIKLENNSTVSALMQELPLEVSMSDLNNNEKYVDLDSSLPTNTYNPKHIEAGDVMLFGNNCLVVFYESFDTSYNYTKIGHIDNLPNFGSGSISMTISAE